ncbi:MAG TPA: polymer-forming cytoskeletal protein [Solirubrobacterales bacterium]|nr:polymer-forming cytoskeletal protein [Solirubrobacterales bacterium]
MRRFLPLVVLVLLVALALPAAAGAAQASDNEEDAIVVIAGDVTVPRGETVDAIVVADGDVRLEGRANGDVVLFSGDATISGRIDGDLVTFGGQARLLPSAHVEGDVRYGDERPIVSGDAIVRGDVTSEDWDDSLEFLPFVGAFVLWLAISISMAILGVLLLLIAPRAADAIHARSRERLGVVIAIGFAVAICLPLAAALAAITLVGIPLAVVIGLALLPAAAIAYVAGAYALGRRIVTAPRSRIWSFLAGLAVLRLAALIPFLGFLAGLAAVIFGFGLIAAAIGAAREQETAPADSPGI